MVFLERTILNTWLAWSKEETLLGRGKLSPSYLHCNPNLLHLTQGLTHTHMSGFKHLIFASILLIRSFCSFQENALPAAGLAFLWFLGFILGCYCAPTRRSFPVSEALRWTSSPLPSLHTTALQPKHLQLLNNSLGLGVYIKTFTHQIPCRIWIMNC